MGTLRKYLMNGAIISAVVSGVSALRQQRKAEVTDWRTYLTWVAWGLTLAVAIGTVRIQSQQDDDPDAPKPALGPKPSKRKK